MIPALFGIAGQTLSPDEIALFRDKPPVGFILFRRNGDTVHQVQDLVASLRDVTGRTDTPILIDQEGGRVQRLKAPNWVDLPAARRIGDYYLQHGNSGPRAVQLHAQAIAGMLAECGINVVCAPDLDVPSPDAHMQIMGDRTWADRAEDIALIGTMVAQELLACGITPIIKHLPGHGRATEDSHYALPVVKATLDDLKRTDFLPFHEVCKALGGEKLWGMSAHLVMTALSEEPVSICAKATQFCREAFGLTGPIIPDAVEMEALGGPIAERAVKTLLAGCDATLHCSGKFDDIRAIAEALPAMTETGKKRFATAEKARLNANKTQANWREAVAELEELLAGSQETKRFATTFDHAAFTA